MRLTKCPRCLSLLIPTTSISGAPSTDWLECSNPTCNTFVDTYTPMQHQTSVHKDSHRIIGNFGSYGTGKTKTSEKEIEKHILITPDANILVGANVSSQYEQTILRDFEKSFPEAFLKNRNVQKQYLDFINDARLMLRPFDDPDKLRSNNYSLVVILEASEVQAEAFHQLKTRLRNTAGRRVIPSIHADEDDKVYDWRKLICESNPDSGWIRSDILQVASSIHQFGRFCKEEYDQSIDQLDPNISCHIASTDVNTFLPDDYIEVNTKNKPDWWVKRFIYGSFKFAEGLVYPNFSKCIVKTPTKIVIPPKYKILAAHDYGLQDPSTFLFGFIDSDRGKLVIYKDIRTTDTSVKDLADMFKEAAKDVGIGQWYTTPIIDPKNNKRDYDKKDLITHYQEYGISFKPGYINREARIFRLNDYIEQGRLEVYDCCQFLIKEMRECKFKPRTLNDNTNAKDVPLDKNDHSITPLEWMCMELPADPKKLFYNMFDQYGRDIEEEYKKYNKGGWQFQEDDIPAGSFDDQGTTFGIEGGDLFG